ncbi:Uncharacterized protein GmHk_09G026252 [Glycine max]|nr:Uncharacterized protein GmHk_09G026252 [Glycine max]
MIGRMGDEPRAGSFWTEEINEAVPTPMRRKRKYRTKKKEYQGWGSTSLIWFLESIGRDTSTKIAQSEVANIVMEYVKQHNLFHKTKKKRIECDERLHSLFGRKTISRLKINDLLESHFKENCEESSDGVFFDSEDDENALTACETPRTAPSERKSQPKKPVFEKPRSCFAAIVPANIKLVYMKRSLVMDLLKDPETFETKVVGSFIRIRCDPNDYLQKNSHQLLQVTGTKKSSEVNGEIHLQVSGFIKDIRIQMLSDDNFSEEECENLHQRVKDGLVKRPMIVDMEQTARVLHEDMIKHWLAREFILLQNLIDRANEKVHWMSTYEEGRSFRVLMSRNDEQESESTTPDVLDKNVENNLQEFWQATYTKSSSVTEVPNEVANSKLDIADLVKQQSNSPKSIPILHRAPEVPLLDMTNNSTMLNCISRDTIEHQSRGLSVQLPPEQHTNDMSKPANSHEAKISQALPDKQMWSSQIRAIRLSDGLPVQQSPEQQTDFAYKNGPSKPAKSQEEKISQALPNKQIRPSQLEFIELSDDLSVQQPPEQQTNFTYKNDMSKPSELHEVKISQALPNKQMLQSQLDVIELSDGLPVQQPPEQQISFAYNNGTSKPAESHEAKISQALPNKQIQSSQIQVIELSDDDEDEENKKQSTTKLVPAVQLDTLMWHYRDPTGNVQGPFSLISLKRWSDAGYFPRGFKVWQSGNRQDEDVLLVNILAQFAQFFPF